MVMDILMIAAFFLGVGGLAFPYLAYPLLLRLRPAKTFGEKEGRSHFPSLSVIIAARNEAAVIREKIRDIRRQNYPGSVDIIVVSDASSDGMDSVVREMENPPHLLRLEERQGKSAAQNAALKQAQGELLVFTDASVLLKSGALEALVEEFRDPTVGCVSGEDASLPADDGDSSATAGLYTRFEILVRRMEMEKTGTLIGVSGCFFAVRRFLRPPVPPEAVDDLYIPLHVIARGFRVVAARDAVAFVRRSSGLGREFRRKVRTFTGALFTMAASLRNERPEGLRRVRFHLLAHKLLRWLGPFFALIALVANVLLYEKHPFFRCFLVLQGLGYAAAVLGLVLADKGGAGPKEGSRRGGRLLALSQAAAFFLMVQAALASAWLRLLLGRPFVTWTPTKRE